MAAVSAVPIAARQRFQIAFSGASSHSKKGHWSGPMSSRSTHPRLCPQPRVTAPHSIPPHMATLASVARYSYMSLEVSAEQRSDGALDRSALKIEFPNRFLKPS